MTPIHDGPSIGVAVLPQRFGRSPYACRTNVAMRSRTNRTAMLRKNAFRAPLKGSRKACRFFSLSAATRTHPRKAASISRAAAKVEVIHA
jgi:hypothetical protein